MHQFKSNHQHATDVLMDTVLNYRPKASLPQQGLYKVPLNEPSGLVHTMGFRAKLIKWVHERLSDCVLVDHAHFTAEEAAFIARRIPDFEPGTYVLTAKVDPAEEEKEIAK